MLIGQMLDAELASALSAQCCKPCGTALLLQLAPDQIFIPDNNPAGSAWNALKADHACSSHSVGEQQLRQLLQLGVTTFICLQVGPICRPCQANACCMHARLCLALAA